MNFKIAIALFILIFSFHFSEAQSFIKKPGKAIDITINPKDGKAYIVDPYNNISVYDSKSNKFNPFANQTAVVKEVAFDNKGKNYIITTSDQLCERKNDSWIPLGPGKYKSLSIDKNNHPWAISTKYNTLQQYYLGTWRAMPKLPAKNCSSAAAISDDYCYIIKPNKTISHFGVSTWFSRSGKAIDITVDLKTKEVYIIDDSKKILKWRKDRRKWEQLNNTRSDFKKLAVYDGKIWAITQSNNVYSYDYKIATNTTETTQTTQMSPTTISTKKAFKKPIQLNQPSGMTKMTKNDYAGTYRFELTRILTYAPEQEMVKKAIDIYGTMGIYLEAKNKNDKIKINPRNGKKNRMLDLPKNNPQKITSKYWKRPRTVEVITNGKKRNYKYFGEHTVDRIRVFKVSNDFANGDLTFDFQTNMSQKLLAGELNFGWKRTKINIKEVDLGKERFFMVKGGSYPGTHLYIGYKITKQ